MRYSAGFFQTLTLFCSKGPNLTYSMFTPEFRWSEPSWEKSTKAHKFQELWGSFWREKGFEIGHICPMFIFFSHTIDKNIGSPILFTDVSLKSRTICIHCRCSINICWVTEWIAFLSSPHRFLWIAAWGSYRNENIRTVRETFWKHNTAAALVTEVWTMARDRDVGFKR